MTDWYNPYSQAGAGYNAYTPTFPSYPQQSYSQNAAAAYRNQQPQNQNNTFQWVQGRAAAEAYLVAPGASVILMDSSEPVIYYKSADANGRYLPMKTYDLVERSTVVEPVHTQQPQIDMTSYVKRDEIATMIEQEVERQLAAPSK